MSENALPRHADTVIVGGGVAGAVVAARLAAASDESVLLLEAGPDYGPREAGRWPAELLDATLMPVESHAWRYTSAAATGTPGLALDCARVIGGCSSHNGCAVVWGWRGDYDAWEAAGNPGWGANALLPSFERASAAFRVTQPAGDEVTPWHRACLDSAAALGLPYLPDLQSLEPVHGMAIGPVNIADGVRWNSSFAYLDPVRGQPNLRIVGNALADRVVLRFGRAVAVDLIMNGAVERIEAGRVVLAAGAYGSPLVLLRSGIGPPDEIAAHGIAPVHELPGVGRGLQDHPSTRIVLSGTPELRAAMDRFVADGGLPREEGTIALERSSRCRDGFDLHLYPIGSRTRDGDWLLAVYAAVMEVRSRGTVRLGGRHPEALPVIDTGYFSDDGETDLTVLVEGLERARALAAAEPLATLAGAEIEPCLPAASLRDYVRAHGLHDYHPTSTCRMGPASDPAAVVDAAGRVHGVDALHVADAAIMPFVPRANTNLPTAAVAEKIAEGLIGRE